MAGQDKDLLLRISRNVELADDVVDDNRPARGLRGEIVGFNLGAVFAKHFVDEVFRFPVTGRTGHALAESGNLCGVSVGLLSVEVVVESARGHRTRQQTQQYKSHKY